jgi:hypothetical protein
MIAQNPQGGRVPMSGAGAKLLGVLNRYRIVMATSEKSGREDRDSRLRVGERSS